MLNTNTYSSTYTDNRTLVIESNSITEHSFVRLESLFVWLSNHFGCLNNWTKPQISITVKTLGSAVGLSMYFCICSTTKMNIFVERRCMKMASSNCMSWLSCMQMSLSHFTVLKLCSFWNTIKGSQRFLNSKQSIFTFMFCSFRFLIILF